MIEPVARLLASYSSSDSPPRETTSDSDKASIARKHSRRNSAAASSVTIEHPCIPYSICGTRKPADLQTETVRDGGIFRHIHHALNGRYSPSLAIGAVETNRYERPEPSTRLAQRDLAKRPSPPHWHTNRQRPREPSSNRLKIPVGVAAALREIRAHSRWVER